VNWDFPPGNYPAGTALPCGATTLGAAYLPIGHASPTVVDVHTNPCVVIKRTGPNDDGSDNYGECDPAQWNSVYGEAQQMGNDLAAFLNRRRGDANLASALAILGETHGWLRPATPGSPYTACRMSTDSGQFLYNYYWAVSTGQDTYNGFNDSGLATWAPSNGLPASIVFRPWEYLVQYDDPQANGCNTITTNPPYAPRP
jgi:hypothetical protein